MSAPVSILIAIQLAKGLEFYPFLIYTEIDVISFDLLKW
jgi:hypothetical protein